MSRRAWALGDVLAIAEIVIAAACYAGGSIVAGRWLKHVPAAPLVAEPAAHKVRRGVAAPECF